MYTLIQVDYLQPGHRIIGSLADMIVIECRYLTDWQVVEVTMHHSEDANIISQRQFMRGSSVKIATN